MFIRTVFVAVVACFLWVPNVSAQPAVSLDTKQKEIFEKHPKLLFFIGRSKNKNLVMYEAAVSPGKRVTEVSARWLLLPSGKYEDFGFWDPLAYGQSLSGAKLTLTAFDKMKQPPPLTVRFDEELKRPVVRTKINGADARLVRVWVEHGPGLIPTVYHVDVFGHDTSGKDVTQRFVINKR